VAYAVRAKRPSRHILFRAVGDDSGGKIPKLLVFTAPVAADHDVNGPIVNAGLPSNFTDTSGKSICVKVYRSRIISGSSLSCG